jgi:multimeric flavodoxin WrbA
MKKIIAVIGSPIKTKSNTAALTRLFLEKVNNFDSSIQYEIIVLGNHTINTCNGCWACTQKGYCIQNDDFREIQEKILACDLLILGSPVYVHSVSAQFKAFADRLFIWYHTMKLIGKPSLSAVTTAHTGRKPTEKYIKLVLYALGTIPIGSLRGIGFKPGQLQNKEKLMQKYTKLAATCADILNGGKKLKSKLLNELYFKGMKMKALHGREYLAYEYNYWKEKCWLHKTYKQVFHQLKN